MASFGWKRQSSVADWLFAEAWQFEFFQAVKLLELANPEGASPGERSNPSEEVVRFLSNPGLAFPPGELRQLTASQRPGSPPELMVNFFGLAGLQGPLPLPDTEMILERSARKDTAFRDFLDIFNHRLVSLLVRIRKAHHFSYTAQSPEKGRIAHYLYSFMGLGADALQNRMGLQDRSLLYYAGILSQQPRSASGLERFFADYFGVRTDVRQLVGQWRSLDADQWTTLGVFGRNQSLGQGALLGTRIWDQQGRFEVSLGPMSLPVFMDFLPNGTAWKPLCRLTRFYAGQDFEFSFRLTLEAAEVPETRLLGQAWLGWTSWLKTRPFQGDDSQVRLRPAGSVA